MASEISRSERMVFRASQELKDQDVVFVGIGLPNLACNLARATHAPNLFMIYESGAVGTIPDRVPVSIGDPALVTNSLSICGVHDIFQPYLQRGNMDVGFLSGAQIYPYGNLNTTVIGDPAKPKVRLPGSGGACGIAAHAKKIFIVMKLGSRAFVEKCDFITSVGRKAHGKSREELELPGSGPQVVITDHGVFRFGDDQKMLLTEIYQGTSIDEMQEKCGFKIQASNDLIESPAPSLETLELLRKKLDPNRYYLKRI